MLGRVRAVANLLAEFRLLDGVRGRLTYLNWIAASIDRSWPGPDLRQNQIQLTGAAGGLSMAPLGPFRF